MTVRTAVVLVWLTRVQHLRAHRACHDTALLWNDAVAWTRTEWESGRKPGKREIEKYCTSRKTEFALHAHTVQGVGQDLWDAISTSRTNRAAGMNVRVPHKRKNCRPLSFTANYGWRITAEGKLNLSLGQGPPVTRGGRGREGIAIPVPLILDPLTGQPVPPEAWGEMKLCWSVTAREWSLHVAYDTAAWTPVPQAQPVNPTAPPEEWVYPDGTVTVAVDEGVINPMTLATPNGDGSFEVLVVNGRKARAVKRLRNKQVGALSRKISRTKNGSRKHKRLVAARKRVQAKTDRQLHNLDHHVSRKAEEFIRAASADPETGELRPVRLAVGDVRGIEQNTNKRRRASRSTRQQLSQWSRGRQEQFLAYKTGLRIDYIPEPHTSQSCVVCGHRRKPRGRVYACSNKSCRARVHRDAVGSLNILSRAVNGGTIVPCITDPDTDVRVTYQRATPEWTRAQSERHGRNQDAARKAGSKAVPGVKPAVAAPNRAPTRTRTPGRVAVPLGQEQPHQTGSPVRVTPRVSSAA